MERCRLHSAAESSVPPSGTLATVDRLASAFQHSAAGMALLSADGTWLEVNDAFCRMVGYAREQLVGHSFTELTHADDVESSVRQLQRLRSGEIRSFGFEKRYLRADGEPVWVRVDASMVLDVEDRPDFIISQVQDITVSRRVKEQLADREARLRSVIRSMREGVVVVDADGSLSLANERAREILGLDDDALRWATLRELASALRCSDGADCEQGEFPISSTLRTGRSHRDVRMRLVRDDGYEGWVEISTEPVQGDGGGPMAVVATFSDITDRVRTERALQESEERLSLALQGAKLGMWDWQLDSRTLNFNEVAEHILGYRRGEVPSRLEAVRELAHPDDAERLAETMDSHLRGGKPFFEIDVRMRRRSGGYVWTNLRGRVTERTASGRPLRVTGMLVDISERKTLERELQRLATTDELTGLYNRRHGTDVLEREVERARRSGGTFSLLLLDIDHFKQVNDRFGHDSGDRVLQEVAELLRGRLRRTDVAARWGGEEFAVVLPDTDCDGARSFAEELLERMHGIRTPDGKGISASFGVVDYRQDESASDVVRRADRLMYRAKHAGRDRVETEE